jgi:hypothetical protein
MGTRILNLLNGKLDVLPLCYQCWTFAKIFLLNKFGVKNIVKTILSDSHLLAAMSLPNIVADIMSFDILEVHQLERLLSLLTLL